MCIRDSKYVIGVRETTLLKLDELHVRHNLSEDLLINDHLNHSVTFHVENSRAKIRSDSCILPGTDHCADLWPRGIVFHIHEDIGMAKLSGEGIS